MMSDASLEERPDSVRRLSGQCPPTHPLVRTLSGHSGVRACKPLLLQRFAVRTGVRTPRTVGTSRARAKIFLYTPLYADRISERNSVRRKREILTGLLTS